MTSRGWDADYASLEERILSHLQEDGALPPRPPEPRAPAASPTARTILPGPELQDLPRRRPWLDYATYPNWSRSD